MRSLLAAAFAAFLTACASMTDADTADPYLWLEEVEGARALDWVRAQNARSLAVLESDPRYAPLKADAERIATSRDRLALGAIRDGHVYNFWQDDTHVRGIWRRADIASYAAGSPRWEILIDVDALAATENANWVWKGASCAPSNRRCMVSLSNGGKDASVWREFDLTARAFVEGGFNVPEAKSTLVYGDEDTLLIASDWGEGSLTESGYPRIAKIWRRGAPLSEAEAVITASPQEMGVFVGALDDADGRRIAIAQRMETFFEGATWRVPLDAPPLQFTLPRKSSVRGLFAGALIATIEEDWALGGETLPQGALIAIDLDTATSAAPRTQILMAPGPRESIEDVAITRGGVLVAGYENVRGRLLRFARNGAAWTRTQLALPENGSVMIAGADEQEETAFAVFTDFLTPSTLYALDGAAAAPRPVRTLPPQFDAAPFVTEQFEATSRDGVRVPYFVLRRREVALDGTNPTLLYGYGGFQVSMTPAYAANAGKLWLERGGVYVMANIRGGGEFGPAWHQAGLRTKRQVVYDDFIAVAEDLIARGITSPRRLGIQGGSNGGLLMGVMLNQRPDLFNAAVIQVPLLDMLRYDQLLAGASWVDEYGSPDDPTERAWLEQLSPYHNLRRRDDFPVPFLVTSTKDDRVHPGHARKYAARLEELGMPFLYFENIDGGHAASTNPLEEARRRALEYTYLMQHLMD